MNKIHGPGLVAMAGLNFIFPQRGLEPHWLG